MSLIQSLRKVVITGGVAVGKSTIIDEVKRNLKQLGHNIISIPEYIDVKEDGLEMLNKYLSKEISVYTFQKYILDYYDEYINSLNPKEGDILLFERCVDDAITCFSNRDHSKGMLSTEDLYGLYMYAKGMGLKYNLPSYFSENNHVFFPVKTADVAKDGSLIAAIINNRTENLIIGLYNSDRECYKRVNVRNRPGEIEAYPLTTIHDFNSIYRRLYQILMSGEKIRFTDLGKLLMDVL